MRVKLLFFATAPFMLLCSMSAQTQTLSQILEAVYRADTKEVEREGKCTFKWENNRQLVFNNDGEGRLTIISTSNPSGSGCSPMWQTTESVIDFLDPERTSYQFSQTIIRGEEVGKRSAGEWRILDGGKIIQLDYSDGTKRTYTTPYLDIKKADPPVSRSPDLVLVCKPVTIRNDSSSYAKCNGTGWENRRVPFSIWFKEKICDKTACEITDNYFGTKSGRIDRITGQWKDACYVYNCEKSTTIAPKF